MDRSQVRAALLAELGRGQLLAALRAPFGHRHDRRADMRFLYGWADVRRRDVHATVRAVCPGQQCPALAAFWHVQRRADVDRIGPVDVGGRCGAAPV
jgi:hypothetical protein